MSDLLRATESVTDMILYSFKSPAESVFASLKIAVDDFRTTAPDDHDTLIEFRGILVEFVQLIEPDTLVFKGFDEDGHRTHIISHFSQVVARAENRPKRGPVRIITGFSICGNNES